MSVWIQFAICTIVITFAGAKLSKYGDVIAEKTGLGGTWIGVALMALVTSLPELITGVSAVVMFDVPNIAAGDVLGSCMFNLFIIAVLDFIGGDEPILAQGESGQTLTAALGVLLLGIVVLAMVAGTAIPVVGWSGLVSPAILALYLGAMYLVSRNEKRSQRERDEVKASQYEDVSKARAFTIYGINAALVIAAATWLPRLGDRIAEMTGLGESFVGSVFIAFSTSLPEFVVTYTALRRGSVDLALGNLLGSNLLNVAVLAIDDLAYTKGSLLTRIEGGHVATAAGAIIMTAIAIVGLSSRGRAKHFGVGLDSVAMMVTFAISTWLSYVLGSLPK